MKPRNCKCLPYMENATCGFCHRDESVEDICGKLHVETVDGKLVAAHHKCLQYSAQLVQYKFENFGGFKIDKVIEELKRGKFLKCHICRASSKGKKNKDGLSKNCATAGCALKNCRKTFHFYCAKMDRNCITKRMLIKYKEQAKEVVMYRVFCSQAHEQQFRSNKSELFLPFQSGKGSSDEDEGSDEGNEDSESNDESEQEDSESNDEREQGKNRNQVCSEEVESGFNSFIQDISILSQATPNNTKSAKKHVEESVKKETDDSSDLMFDNDNDDDNDDLSPQLNLLYETSDDEQKEKVSTSGKNNLKKPANNKNEDGSEESSFQLNTLSDTSEEDTQKNNVETSSSDKNNLETLSPNRTKIDRIPDTPNSIKVRAEINHVKPDSKVPTSKTSETKKMVRAKMKSNETSDDEIRDYPEDGGRPSRKCTRNIGPYFSQKISTTEHKKVTPKRHLYNNSDSLDDDFMSEKDVKKKHSKFTKNIENTKPGSSPTKTLLDKQIVLNVKPRENSETKEHVDVESLEPNIINQPLVKSLSVQLQRLDHQKVTPPKDKNNTESTKGKSDLIVIDDDSSNGISKNNGKKDNNGNKRLRMMNGKSATKRAKLSEDTSNNGNQNCYLNLESDTGGSSTESEVENSRYGTCGLILTQDLECSNSIRVELLKQAGKELNVTEDYLAFWLDAFKLEDLQKEIMPHLMNDIGQILCNDEGDKGKIANLLTNADRLHSQLPNYSYVLNLYKSMDKGLVHNMQENVFKQLRNNLTTASRKAGYTVGKLLTVQKMNALILMVNDKLDPKGLIRRKMFPDTTDRLFECSASTHLHSLNKEPSVLQAEKEKCKILNFIKEEFGKDFNLELSPTETVFQSTESSNVKTISEILEKLSTKPAETKNKVLCLFPVDNNVVNFSPFCKKLLAQFVWQTIQDESTRVIAIIHLDSSVNTFDDIVRTNVVEEQHLCMLVANDPNQTPVSCAVVTNIRYRDRLSRQVKK